MLADTTNITNNPVLAYLIIKQHRVRTPAFLYLLKDVLGHFVIIIFCGMKYRPVLCRYHPKM